VSSVWATSVAFYRAISECPRERMSVTSKEREGKYLVSLVGSSGSTLALGAGSELSKVTVVVTLPVDRLVRLSQSLMIVLG
jgi:hypothetical protein